MASISFTIFSMCLLGVAYCGPLVDNGGPIELIVPEECKDKDFCSVLPQNYDLIQKRINELIPKDMLTDVEHREGHATERVFSNKTDWHNCPTMEEMEKPTLARDPILREKLNYVVQLYNYEQKFLAVTCPAHLIKEISNSNDKRQCFPDLFPRQRRNIGMKSNCEQRFSTRLLYIYDHTNDALVMKPYNIPVHCSCKLTSTMY